MMSAMFSIPTDTFAESQHRSTTSNPADKTYANEVRGDARYSLLFGIELLVCRRRRMNDQCLRVAYMQQVSAIRAANQSRGTDRHSRDCSLDGGRPRLRYPPSRPLSPRSSTSRRTSLASGSAGPSYARYATLSPGTKPTTPSGAVKAICEQPIARSA